MSWGFEIGRVYDRRSDIHARFGGQQQGGIITPAKHSLVIIITGEEGLEHGYADRTRGDGVFEYFGEGQVGDMQMQKGNRAIAEHSADGKSLLLFRKVPEGVRFVGEMVYEAHHIERAAQSGIGMCDHTCSGRRTAATRYRQTAHICVFAKTSFVQKQGSLLQRNHYLA